MSKFLDDPGMPVNPDPKLTWTQAIIAVLVLFGTLAAVAFTEAFFRTR